jgi:hypothetical protein
VEDHRSTPISDALRGSFHAGRSARTLGVMRRLNTISQRGAARRSRKRARRVDVERVGAITVRLHHPRVTARTTPALLWAHGGGYVIGTAAPDDALCRVVAEQLNVLVAAVDYRLAPEHPFPVPLEDCHDALVWLAARPDVDAERIAIGGASAGGGLAAALALLARDRGVVTPVLQLLAYPMLDDRTTLRTDIDERHLRLWNCASNRFGWSCYLGTTPGQPAPSTRQPVNRHGDQSRHHPGHVPRMVTRDPHTFLRNCRALRSKRRRTWEVAAGSGTGDGDRDEQQFSWRVGVQRDELLLVTVDARARGQAAPHVAHEYIDLTIRVIGHQIIRG